MGDILKQLFGGDFMPHGHCLLWRNDLLLLHVGSDAIIGLSYFSIPLSLVYICKKRTDLLFNWMVLLFATFIFACGTTHFFDIFTVWNGYYFAEGLVKLVCALVSIITAILLWPLIPKILNLPSMTQLGHEISERRVAEDSLRRARQQLELDVKERTKELLDTNLTLQQKTERLERFHSLVIDREYEMMRLKTEINGLLKELGREAKYEVEGAKVE